ncbi:MAG: hypothetical protein ACW98X_12345 [Promethearchaeota archaeon]|jgi:hypothetical protein
MPVDPATAVYNLMQTDPHIIAACVLKGKEIIYTTDNWDISADIDRVVSSWMGQNATFIMVSGVKYSVFQIESERLFAQSIKGEGSIIGAKDEEYKLIAYMDPDGYGLGATMDVQRALGSMSSKAGYMDQNAQLDQASQMGEASSVGGNTVNAPSSVGGTGVDPQLQGEIKAFLDWVKDGEGLAGYISYYLQQNNAQIITELSKIYNELRQIFGV